MEGPDLVAGIGQRLRQLRELRYIGHSKTGIPHASLSRIECGHVTPGLAVLETLCESYGIGFARLFATEEKFEKFFLLENRFVAEVLPYLKQLSAWQKEYILKVLEAAPKSAPSRRRTSSASRKSTASKDSSTTART